MKAFPARQALLDDPLYILITIFIELLTGLLDLRKIAPIS